ncbi:MAG TPA: RNA polymerase sigma factor [Ignavibacteriales bacterium]|nr:RNA polymerase sigma factor [Ignavibacteriales bacterium]
MKRDELFREALEENQKMIFRVCCRFFGPGENAKDAYQDILLKIWMNIEGFRGECQLKTWIYRISVNVCITFRSKNKRKSSLFVPFSEPAYRVPDEEKLLEDEENKLLFFRKFMDELSGADKALVSLYLEDLDTREMSRITGLSESNVRVRIHRIKSEIKKQWEVEYGTR